MRRVLILMILLAASVSAFNVSISPSQRSVVIDDVAAFNITISHSLPQSERFDVFSPDVVWDVRTEEPLNLGPGGSLSTVLLVKPLYIAPGVYSVPLHVRRMSTGDVVKRGLLLEILSKDQPALTYLPAVRGSVEVPQSIDPRNPAVVKVNLENQNALNLPEVHVKLRGGVLTADKKTSLESFQKKTLSIEIPLSSDISPQRDLLRASVIAYDSEGKAYQFDLSPQEFEIIPYSDILSTVEEDVGVFRTERVITLNNTGNVPRSTVYKFEVGFLQKFFTKADPEAEMVGNQLVWEMSIEAKGHRKVEVITNYWSLVVFFALVCLVFVAYYIFRSPIVLQKRAHVVTTREGGISEMKVLLTVKNRGRGTVNKVRVLDLIPTFGEYAEKAGYGTIPPSGVVKNERKGTVVKWELPSMGPGEDVILSYRIKSKFKILGSVQLPPASAKFEISQGREQSVKSSVAETGLR